MISCSQAVKQLWDYLEDAVQGPERQALEEHLGTCRRCCGEMEFADELRNFLQQNSADDLPPEVRRRLQAHLDAL
jgi:anti-sigma factor (TIGR02949 family)